VRALIGFVLLALLGVAVVGGPAQSASAATVVLVSTDGVSYTPSLSVGLFDHSGLLVPGASTPAELWLKNPTTSRVTVRVTVGALVSSSADLGQNITMTAQNIATGDTVTRNWNDLTHCAVMLQPVTMAGGSVVHLHLILTMLNAQALLAQSQSLSFIATVAMKDDAAGAFPATACDPAQAVAVPQASGHSSSLSFTGGTFPVAFFLLGVALFGTGWIFFALRKRRMGGRS
jgi:hypothetical protein